MTDIAKLRASNYALAALPETIPVPVQPPARSEPIEKPLVEATVDELTFAIAPAEEAFHAAAERMYALKKLLRLAREAGAIGTDRPVDVIARRS